MGQWLSWVKSNDKEILTILDNLALKAKETAEQLVGLFSNIEQAAQYQTKIRMLEREADELTRSIFAELNKTFITPLDREDIQRIAAKTDDVIDYMEGIAGRIISFKITSTPPYMLQITKELEVAIGEVHLLLSRLKDVKADK
jgi:predicted phosphate transport protein (TIGR00153 family)